MEYTISEWHGDKRLDFVFEGRQAIVVCPENAVEGNKWLVKMEYFDAFPEVEIEMLKRGYHIVYLQNQTRWSVPVDFEIKKRFFDFIIKEFNLNKKCVPVGMSCGGLHSIYFAAKYPEYIAAMYLDAPVVNLLSCPARVGRPTDENLLYDEFVGATGMTVKDLINYRNHPYDHIDELIANKIPMFLACGTADDSCPYEENGKAIYDKYKVAGAKIELAIKEGGTHHPHNLPDNTPIIKFIIENY